LEQQKLHYEKELNDIKFLHEQELLQIKREASSPLLPRNHHSQRPSGVSGSEWKKMKCEEFCIDCDKWEEICQNNQELRSDLEILTKRIDE